MTGGAAHGTAEPRGEYILPVRWAEDSGLDEFVHYLEELCAWIPVTVVDGSDAALFARHRALFPAAVRHIRPAPGTGNGKVTAVMTAARLSGAERLVIADDDVRYTAESLAAIVNHLDDADVARPQNYFTSLPWHACWDTSRTLINRALSSDFPGTLAVRRAALQATEGYSAVLFENLELIRTVKAAGGREKLLPDLFVARRPPTSRHFFRQRIRQAYDDFAQPGRLIAELALLPAVAGLAALPHHRRAPAVFGLAGAALALAEIGRRRHNGRSAFPARTSWFAPLWVMERALCIWIALFLRVSGGIPYSGTRLRTAAHSPTELRRRHEGKLHPNPSASPFDSQTREHT
ncbi:glycosyltransferase family 2 protein [Arthrobacter sp. ISL-5]|uniref:glycosyltransferase n=1 Tax=Arthrobacter sp. ISL-5 TaxID=2819111 RepID=UPI001BE50723|nr:glycosyltransferase family 2 protein [Arthrobacter sp. ISL-5]MBT2554094.1 glycosyltransferase family 2 protein [Arthrobacter sp. ISL-5]